MQESAQELSQHEFFPHPKEIEPVNKSQLDALAHMLGLGAILVDFTKIDPRVGRGVLEGQDRCLWTTEGKRVTVAAGGGAVLASLSDAPDPLYARLKAEKGL